ncbi:MAG: hypothetical protein ACI9EF_003184, partial [Pseudohongiellaceae bacterium]
RAEVLAGSLAQIELITAPGHGVVTVLALMQEQLPQELWLTGLHTSSAVSATSGAVRPVIVVEGSGKELDRDLNSAVSELTVRLREHGSIEAVIPTMSTDARGRFTFELEIDPSVTLAADQDDLDSGEGT